jgi:hypothetical protein
MLQLIQFLPIAGNLESAGLVWQPEIGDEISSREHPEQISILVDPNGMTPKELRNTFMWLPTVEQMVFQLEARKAILFHAGLEISKNSVYYKTVVQCTVPPTVEEMYGKDLENEDSFSLKRDLMAKDSAKKRSEKRSETQNRHSREGLQRSSNSLKQSEGLMKSEPSIQQIESKAESLRVSLGKALVQLLTIAEKPKMNIH